MQRFLGVAALCLSGAAVFACGGTYVVQPGETLSTIANVQYKDAGKWADIHSANKAVIGEDPSAVRAGQTLTLDCIDGLPAADVTDKPEETVTRHAPLLQAEFVPPTVRLVTGGDLRPFTDETTSSGGMMTELVSAAMTAALGDVPHQTYWFSDWSNQRDLVLGSQAMDIGFPYARPDCSSEDASVCDDYYFSEPMFEFLELLYIDVNRPMAFTQTSDLEGRTLCRPVGHSMDHLTAEMRQLVESDAVVLEQTELVSECFFNLVAGDVDAVVLNEFTGRQTLTLMGLEGRVIPVSSRPVAIASLHAIIHKEHPDGRLLRRQLDVGLQSLRLDGSHHEIISRHLSPLWMESRK